MHLKYSFKLHIFKQGIATMTIIQILFNNDE